MKKYCGACSALFGICEVCGIDTSGNYPMRPVAKMLSAENGRGGGDNDSDDELL
jgi:hypothetical protein